MSDRNAVKRLIETQGPAAARYQFGDAIVTDVLLKGVSADLRAPVVTHDCGCGGTCGCGGHGHIHPAHTNDREARHAARRERRAVAMDEIRKMGEDVRARARRLTASFDRYMQTADALEEKRRKHQHDERIRSFLSSGRRAR